MELLPNPNFSNSSDISHILPAVAKLGRENFDKNASIAGSSQFGPSTFKSTRANLQIRRISPVERRETAEQYFNVSFLYVLPSVMLYLMLLGVGLFISLRFPALSLVGHWRIAGFNFLFQIPLILLPAFLVLVKSCISLHSRKFFLGYSHMGISTGFGSWVCRRQEISYSAVAYVGVNQGLYGRLLNLGNVAVGRSTEDAAELVMRGIANPDKIAKILRSRVNESHTC